MMQKKKYKDLTRWLGETADKKVLLERFIKAFINAPLNGDIHYAFTFPGEERCAELLYTLRLCCFEVPPGETVTMRGAFDGIVSTRNINDKDILCGSYNAVTDSENPAASYGGFSVVFHTHHIRLHYVAFKNGEIVENICCYTEKPASGALLQMVQALDIIIHDVGNDRNAVCRPLVQALLFQLYNELQLSFESAMDDTSKLARKIKYHLECNFFKFINCSVICDELGVNRSYASQIFHRNFGMTMSDYLLDLRLDAAKKMLSSPDDLKICDIARLCGFQDSGYFSRIFRKHTNFTPLEYRKSCCR